MVAYLLLFAAFWSFGPQNFNIFHTANVSTSFCAQLRKLIGSLLLQQKTTQLKVVFLQGNIWQFNFCLQYSSSNECQFTSSKQIFQWLRQDSLSLNILILPAVQSSKARSKHLERVVKSRIPKGFRSHFASRICSFHTV